MTVLLFDHLWQSTLFAAAAGLLTLMFTANSAAVRYWLWFAASVKFLIPFSALMALSTYFFQSFAPKAPPPPVFFDLRAAAEPFAATEPFSGTAPPVLISPIPHGIDWSPLLLGLWALGFAVILTIWLGRWLKLRAAIADASSLSIDAPMPVKSSAGSLEPGLIGIWRPVLILPQGILAHLSQLEMRAILAHEHCHLRRRDNLLAAVHMAVEALFWFHPLVWWLGTRLIAERENACDEAVLASGNDPQTYAEGILKVCQFYLHSPLDCASGISGADLKKRMETIMESKFTLRLSALQKSLLGTCAAGAFATPIVLGLLTAPPVVTPAIALAAYVPPPGAQAAVPSAAPLASDNDVPPTFQANEPATKSSGIPLVQANHKEAAGRETASAPPVQIAAVEVSPTVVQPLQTSEPMTQNVEAVQDESNSKDAAGHEATNALPDQPVKVSEAQNPLAPPPPGNGAPRPGTAQAYQCLIRQGPKDCEKMFIGGATPVARPWVWDDPNRDFKRGPFLSGGYWGRADEENIFDTEILVHQPTSQMDIYDVKFKFQEWTLYIGPPNADGKIDALAIRFYGPHSLYQLRH